MGWSGPLWATREAAGVCRVAGRHLHGGCERGRIDLAGCENLLLAARALGLGAAPTTLGLRDRPAAKAVLDLPSTIEPFCLIPVGYPTGRFGPVSRRPVAEILRWDRWSKQ